MADIKPEQVPKKVVRAAEKAWGEDEESFCPNAKTIAAAINAWPEARRVKGYFTHDTDYYEPAFVLPLSRERMSDALSGRDKAIIEQATEIERLRAALRGIAGIDPWTDGEQGYVDRARAALKDKA